MHGNGYIDKRECTVQDWENLKASFADAAECLEGEDVVRGCHLLRGVMRECTRFLRQFRDPAVIFSIPTATKRSSSPGPVTPTEERLSRDWGEDRMDVEDDTSFTYSMNRSTSYSSSNSHEHLSGALRVKGERPTAFHSIYGCTLFLYGHLLANVPTANLVEEGECKDPESYYMAAIEVFEQAEALPVMTTRNDAATRSTLADKNRAHLEDWLMAIAWGRTLVGLAQRNLPSSSGARYPSQTSSSRYGHSSQPSRSSPILLPLNLCTSTPGPHTQSTMTAHSLLMQAQDHFMRGIFHMPHSTSRFSSPQQNHHQRQNSIEPRSPEIAGATSPRRRSGTVFHPSVPQVSPPDRPKTRTSMRGKQSPDPGLPTSSSSSSFSRPSLHINLSHSSPPPSSYSQARIDYNPRLNRSRTLYTIGAEVIRVSERLLPNTPSSSSYSNQSSSSSSSSSRMNRQRERDCIEWAEYADGVLVQLENELRDPQGARYATVSPSKVSSARGRCAHLINRAMGATAPTPPSRELDHPSNSASSSSKSKGPSSTSPRGYQNDNFRKGM